MLDLVLGIFAVVGQSHDKGQRAVREDDGAAALGMQAQAQQTTQALEQLAMRQDKQAEAVMRLFKIIDIAQQQNAGSPNQVYTGGGNPADQQMAPAAGMPSPETMPFG